MPFDNENTADLTALKVEVTTDPENIGYNLHDTASLLAGLKTETSETIKRDIESITIPEIAGIIVASDYTASNAYDKEWIKMFIRQTPDTSLKDFLPKFQEVFNGKSTLTAAVALRNRTARREEVLFGIDTNITRKDLIFAKEHG